MAASSRLNSEDKQRLSSFLKLLKLHRSEVENAYNEVATIYDGFARVWDGHIAAPALDAYNRIIQAQVKPGAFVLDAGAGTGERTLALLRYSQPGKIIALDASEAMLEVARTKIQDVRVEFMRGDITHLPFADATFDVVSCSWAIEILVEPRIAVQEFLRVIKPDGLVIYAFCSLPEGTAGKLLKFVIDHVSPRNSPLTDLLSESERPFHACERSSLKQFTGGLTTVITLAKCCQVTAKTLPAT